MSEPTSPAAAAEAYSNQPIRPAGFEGISRTKTAFVFAVPAIAVGYMLLAGSGVHSGMKYERKKAEVHPVEAEAKPYGPALYKQHCSRCHGENGKADGYSSEQLNPWARKFGEDKFQLATTTNGVPSDDDLHYIINRGIPGTAMPSFEQLTEDERKAIISHVRKLTWAGIYAKLFKRAEADDDVDIPRIIQNVDLQVMPGPQKKVPDDLPPMSPESLARGEKIFAANCATCHGPKGAGDGPQVKGMKNDNGQPTAPRDLARGVYKGGGDHDRMFLRLSLGMPGTPMPASSTLKPSEVGDLVNFVQKLATPAAP